MAPHPRPALIAVDLDGTLLDPAGQPHARDVRALRALTKAGVPVSILTGRLYSGTRAMVEVLDITGPVGCVDGSHVVDTKTHTTVAHHGVRGDHARTLRENMARSGPATFLFARDAVVHDAAGDPFLSYVSTWSTDLRRAHRVVEHELWEAEDGITAVVAVGTAAQIGLAGELLASSLAGVVQYAAFPLRKAPASWGMVVRASGSTKGTALRWLAEHHGIPLSETVCVGDWLNDVSMFEVAGRSFAMGQAPDAVKRAATSVLSETNETGGGIAAVVREVFGLRVDAA